MEPPQGSRQALAVLQAWHGGSDPIETIGHARLAERAALP